MPPTRVRTDVPVERCIDENIHYYARASWFERVADHLADLDAMVEDRRADIDRAKRYASQRVLMPRLPRRHDGRILKSRKRRLPFGRTPDIHADVGTREQRTEPGEDRKSVV